MIDTEILPFFIEEAEDLLHQWEDVCFKLEKDNGPENHNSLFRIAHSLKGASRSCGLQLFGEVLHEIEDIITKLRNNEIGIDQCHRYLLDSQAILLNWLERLKSDMNYNPAPSVLSKIRAKSHELKLEKQMNAEVTESSAVLTEASSSEPVTTSSHESKNQKSQETFRVKADKVERLIFGIGELTVYKSMLQYSVKSGKITDKDALQCIEAIEKTCTDLQNHTFSLRLVSAESLMRRLQRVASDVASATGKKIEFVTNGADQEIDKVVLDTILDPLIHIIRNSVDHGVENPEKREKNGKNPVGKVELTLENESGELSFIIKDDGAGIDPEKVFSKAIEKGVIPSSSRMTDDEKVNLIFLPGFSTADKLSDISGRGVGMDVVKTTIDKLGGRVKVESVVGKGSVFKLNIPVSLNLIDCFITDNGENTYLIPISQVHEVISLKDFPPIKQNGLSGISWRDNVIPLRPLPGTSRERDPKEDSVGIVVSHMGKNFVLSLKKISGTQQVFLRALNGATAFSDISKGNAVLNNGKASVVLDMDKVVATTFLVA